MAKKSEHVRVPTSCVARWQFLIFFFRAYVPRNERLHYLRLIGADTTPFEKNKFQEQRDEEMKEATKEEGENGEDKDKNVKETKEEANGEKEKPKDIPVTMEV